ncbi:MAG: hypothetical protein AB2693_19915 [Candidatus Thiodiazotropha sp.]
MLAHLEEDLAALHSSPNLGIADNILWLGAGGMHWSELIPKFQCTMIFNPPPDLIVIHVGGNDLVTVKQAKLIKVIRRDLQYLASVFPTAIVVWSDILPRKSWRGIENNPQNLAKMNEKRKRINRAGRQVIHDLTYGRAIIHELDATTPGLFKPDGVHLTLIGNAIFLNTFKEALRFFLNNNEQKVYDANK